MRRCSRHDRAFFEKYPRQTDYSRPFVRGEAWPEDVRCTRVMVVPVRPGQRIVMALDGTEGDEMWMQYDYDVLAATDAEDAAYAARCAIGELMQRIEWRDSDANGATR